MKRNRVSSTFIHWIMKLDAANSPLLGMVPVSLKKQFSRQVLGGLQSVHQDGPIKLHGVWFDTPSTVQSRIYIAKLNDAIRQLMHRCLRPGMKVADVGASVGYHTILAARKVGPSGHVYAFEPLAGNTSVLENNLMLNNLTNVTVIPCAAGRSDEARTLYIRDSAHNSFFPNHTNANVTETREVSVVAIDDVVNGDIDFVKIDVEGAELEVLQGMQRTINDQEDIQLIVEWFPDCQRSAGLKPEQLPLWLIDAGFTLWAIDDRFVGPIAQSGIADILHTLSHSKRNYSDLYAKRLP